MAKQKILACIYAGDPNDEYCSTCDGITMVVDDAEGGTIPATKCGGYEAPKEDPKPVAPTATKPATKPVANEVKPPENVTNNEIPWQEPKQDPAKPRETNETVPVNTFTPAKNSVPFYTKEIQAESGITVEIKNPNGTSNWYKIAYGETRVVADNLDTAVLEEAKKDLWETVNGEVDRQIAEIYEMLQNTK